MIYSRLFGGAGNQLFQYAAGRALADHLGTELVLDSRYMVLWDENRGYCFPNYGGTRFIESNDLPPSKFDSKLRYALWRGLKLSPTFRREQGLGFNDRFFDTADDSYLHGYWQSLKYFGQKTDWLRDELRLTTPLTPETRAMAEQIKAAPMAVSVHVRRGDYVADGGFAACPPEYFSAAVDHLQTKLGKPLTLFVFSNDPAWAAENLDLKAERVIVDINAESAGHFDMHLQSLCNHHIIANSTFSWWGAWLNPDPDKIVIAPKTWFAPGKPSNPDLVPDTWIRL